ncbi:hypothetical protein fnug_348 [Pseudomonas phage fnug]|uniref:Uncharacterized protein n=2 Tax=Phikzvirus phiKZ TaxID=169683 RepID=A0A192Y5D7_9CAUD|nr:hypothetical protein KTN4_356 [Pseudomonas phage KTN4]QJB22991.1 hypothetical protein fnug_348 [Pseudomonas phage fnug]UXD83328.1 hypothetical protein NP274_00277 [Pseudomonas phage Koomba boorn-mokiny kep-wari Wadjak 1]
MAFHFTEVDLDNFINDSNKGLKIKVGKQTLEVYDVDKLNVVNSAINKLVYHYPISEEHIEASLSDDSLKELNEYLLNNGIQNSAKMMIDAVLEIKEHYKDIDSFNPRVYKLKSMHTKNTDDVYLIIVISKADDFFETMQGYIVNKSGNLIRTTVQSWRFEKIEFNDLAEYDQRWLSIESYINVKQTKNNIIKEQEAELTKFIYYSTPS